MELENNDYSKMLTSLQWSCFIIFNVLHNRWILVPKANVRDNQSFYPRLAPKYYE